MEDLRPLGTDGVVQIDGEVLLLEREEPPFEGYWTLPGGEVPLDERASETCVRRVMELTGTRVEATDFLGLYDDPDRDERGNAAAVYRCRPVGDVDPTPGGVAASVATFPPSDLPELGWDHGEILRDAL